jgi:hypothetical protein
VVGGEEEEGCVKPYPGQAAIRQENPHLRVSVLIPAQRDFSSRFTKKLVHGEWLSRNPCFCSTLRAPHRIRASQAVVAFDLDAVTCWAIIAFTLNVQEGF